MKDLDTSMLQELNSWISSMKDKTFQIGEIQNTSQQEMKAKWLGKMEEWRKENPEMADPVLERIQENAQPIREAIGKLVYEGKVNEEEIHQILIDHNVIEESLSSEAQCFICTACAACIGCLACVVCAVSGIIASASSATSASSASSASSGYSAS